MQRALTLHQLQWVQYHDYERGLILFRDADEDGDDRWVSPSRCLISTLFHNLYSYKSAFSYLFFVFVFRPLSLIRLNEEEFLLFRHPERSEIARRRFAEAFLTDHDLDGNGVCSLWAIIIIV